MAGLAADATLGHLFVELGALLGAFQVSLISTTVFGSRYEEIRYIANISGGLTCEMTDMVSI